MVTIHQHAKFQATPSMRFPEMHRNIGQGEHWNRNVVVLMKFSSLAALEVVKMTTSSAASDENFVKMTTFSFQWGTTWKHNASGAKRRRHKNESKGLISEIGLVEWPLSVYPQLLFLIDYDKEICGLRSNISVHPLFRQSLAWSEDALTVFENSWLTAAPRQRIRTAP